ncbi:hypothetical protein HELRODRAFT_167913 [Helobdella robusta]|uniref:G-protein coupled receptors family 1 profile domain-containing protein n=1 Tax=Helobdella robusta TaxID=6412 RepID=T1EZY2_HELRO|nr:hypothetical protein HELRODRAFT_167913 [Helobdella robusta]ESO10065.1 hypothetical protein HELRODRAFT_167913 [Helobdella robusta]
MLEPGMRNESTGPFQTSRYFTTTYLQHNEIFNSSSLFSTKNVLPSTLDLTLSTQTSVSFSFTSPYISNSKRSLDYYRFTWLYISPLILVIGLFGNILTLSVVNKRPLKHSPTRIYLSAMSVGDSLALIWKIIPEFMRVAGVLNFSSINEWSCRIEQFSFYTSSDAAIWFMVAFTIDRLVAVCFPLKKRSLCKPSSAKIFVGAVVIAAIFKNAHVFWTRGLVLMDEIPDDRKFKGNTKKLFYENNFFNYHKIKNVSVNEITTSTNTRTSSNETMLLSGRSIEPVINKINYMFQHTTHRTPFKNGQLKCQRLERYKYFEQDIRTWLAFVFITVLPATILIVSNVMIVVTLVRVHRFRTAGNNGSAPLPSMSSKCDSSSASSLHQHQQQQIKYHSCQKKEQKQIFDGPKQMNELKLDPEVLNNSRAKSELTAAKFFEKKPSYCKYSPTSGSSKIQHLIVQKHLSNSNMINDKIEAEEKYEEDQTSAKPNHCIPQVENTKRPSMQNSLLNSSNGAQPLQPKIKYIFTGTSLMCLAVSITFVVCVAPSIILTISKTEWKRKNEKAYGIATLVNNQLAMVNHAINFILYCMTGQQFRRELKSLMQCRRRKPSHHFINKKLCQQNLLSQQKSLMLKKQKNNSRKIPLSCLPCNKPGPKFKRNYNEINFRNGNRNVLSSLYGLSWRSSAGTLSTKSSILTSSVMKNLKINVDGADN